MIRLIKHTSTKAVTFIAHEDPRYQSAPPRTCSINQLPRVQYAHTANEADSNVNSVCVCVCVGCKVVLSDATKTALTSLAWFGPTPSLRLSSPTISPLGDESSSSQRIKCGVRSVGVTTWTGLAEMNSGGGGGRAINQNAATDLCLCVCVCVYWSNKRRPSDAAAAVAVLGRFVVIHCSLGCDDSQKGACRRAVVHCTMCSNARITLILYTP